MDASTEPRTIYHSAIELYLVVTIRNIARAARMIWWIISRAVIAAPRVIATAATTLWREFGPMLETREGAGGAIGFATTMLAVGGYHLPSEYQQALIMLVFMIASAAYALIHTGRRRHPMPGDCPDPNVAEPAPTTVPGNQSAMVADQAATVAAGQTATSTRIKRPAKPNPRRRTAVKAKRKRA
jgi:hypothetical protein